MVEYVVKERTPFQKFMLLIELFEVNATLLAEQEWLEFVIFTVPNLELRPQDLKDLSQLVSKRVNATTEFEFKKNGIEVYIERIGGVK